MITDWKIKKTIDNLLRNSTNEHEALTLLMHVAAVLFSRRIERDGLEKVKADYLEWYYKVGAMLEGRFDRDSTKS